MIGDGLQIVGIMVHVMSVVGLRRATMSAPISCNDAIAFAEEEKHLRVPIVRAQRPAVAEHDGLAFTPVFVIDVDVSSVFFSDGDVWHVNLPSGLRCTKTCASRSRVGPVESSSSEPSSSRKVSVNLRSRAGTMPSSCGALSRKGTRLVARFHRSKLRLGSRWQGHDA